MSLSRERKRVRDLVIKSLTETRKSRNTKSHTRLSPSSLRRVINEELKSVLLAEQDTPVIPAEQQAMLDDLNTRVQTAIDEILHGVSAQEADAAVANFVKAVAEQAEESAALAREEKK